jgi:hypothetical protein
MITWAAWNVSDNCNTLDKTWNYVTTEPSLPVNHRAEVTLKCPAGYLHTGSNVATCQNGQLVPESEPPQSIDKKRVQTIKFYYFPLIVTVWKEKNPKNPSYENKNQIKWLMISNHVE